MRGSLPSEAIGCRLAALTWQRAQLSRVWQTVHVAVACRASAPWLLMKSGASCHEGFGNAFTALSLSAVARGSGTWQVRHGEVGAKCDGAGWA
jgi:hypothetical protein